MTFFQVRNHPYQYGISLTQEEASYLLTMIESARLPERRVFDSLKRQIKEELNEKKFK